MRSDDEGLSPDDAARVGMPEYRVWSTHTGPFGECFLEAEYASAEAKRVRTGSAVKDDEFAAKVAALFSHTMPGTAADWELDTEDLG